MSAPDDPFHHHPELRGQIVDPSGSFFRNFDLSVLERICAERGLACGWWHADAEREALRRRELAGRSSGDLWVFAYASLMWDPALRFVEVRRARVAGHARRFILKDVHGARGTAERPGLMAALDAGSGCEGLAFRIPAELVEEETEILWRRERIAPAYEAAFVTAEVAGEPCTALTFVADHSAPEISAGLTREEQVALIATGSGFLGSSLDYIRQIEAKFLALGIEDAHVTALCRDAERLARELADRPEAGANPA